MTDINDLKGRFYVQEAHIRLRDGGKTARKNGVVYTPAECVDFINNSVNALLVKRFGVRLNDRREISRLKKPPPESGQNGTAADLRSSHGACIMRAQKRKARSVRNSGLIAERYPLSGMTASARPVIAMASRVSLCRPTRQVGPGMPSDRLLGFAPRQ